MKPKLSFEAQLQLAIQAHRGGDLSFARALYEEILEFDPDRPEVLYNLCLLLIKQEAFESAIHYLQKVLSLYPNHAGANYQLANIYFRQEQFTLAQQHYEKTLQEAPGHIDALNNLGAVLLHEQQYEQAIECFSAIIAIEPKHTIARNNLAASLLDLQRYRESCEQYQLLLTQTPDDIGAQYSYGIALLESNQLPEAITQFQTVLAVQPEHLNAKSNLGIAYLKSNQPDHAIEQFSTVLKQEPNNQTIHYLYAALTGKEQPSTAPTKYVQDLFNHYALHYELHMIDKLHYTVPQQLRELFDQQVKHIEQKKWDILDLGCGTGLSGLAFHDLANKLIGVDLSAKMLGIAKHKRIYDELYENDLITILRQTTFKYDLLIAADTFNYFGDFDDLFAACHGALKPNGWLLFSIEHLAEIEAWKLHLHSRYAHSSDYIEKIAKKFQFNLWAKKETTLRQQQNQGCIGELYLLRMIR